jgi:diguanylate cyclase (GGDEF)-like protein/PAS domain S-box-containing protein
LSAAQSRSTRAALTVLALTAFAVLYPPLYWWAGPGITALCALPIMVVGYLWGMRAGALTGFLVFPVGVVELVAFHVPQATLVLVTGGAAPAAIVVMTLVGAVVGRLRELGQMIETQTVARRKSDRRYGDLFQNAHDIVFTYDLECELTSINPAAQRLLGYTTSEMIGMDPGLLIPGDQWGKVQEMLQDCLANTPAAIPYEVEWVTKDGRRVTLEISPVLVEEGGRPFGIQAIARDISERKRVEERLRHQAFHDPMTDLPNRTLLEERLAEAIKAASRQKDTLAVLILDLEEFKAINDTFGHHFGDDLLRQVGARLTAAMRETDIVARMGGADFGFLLGGVHDERGAIEQATKFMAALDDSPIIEGQRIAVAATAGIALYPVHGENPATLLRRADVALYAAKRSGQRWAVYRSEDDRHSPRQLALRAELPSAIANGELRLHFQPKAIGSGVVEGVEALVRWQHPRHGLMTPDQFVPIAEHGGLIGDLTAFVIRAALAASDRWCELGYDLTVAVNLSSLQLQDSGLPDAIRDVVAGHPRAAGRLQLELTESAVMADAERAMEILTRISDMGIHISIDDFGTGYSSLSYLRRLPVKEIKIDRSFVTDLTRNEADQVIVRSIIDLGHNLGLSVVAEGVEDRATMSMLAALGCDLMQGHYLSRPLAEPDLEAWLKGRSTRRELSATADPSHP